MKVIDRISNMGQCLLWCGALVGMGITSWVHGSPTEFRVPLSLLSIACGMLLFAFACFHMIELADLKALHDDEDKFEKRSTKSKPSVTLPPLFREYRDDGWPLCPKCGEDELYSHLHWMGERPPLQAFIAAGMACYTCDWKRESTNDR